MFCMGREPENHGLDAWDNKSGHTPFRVFDDHLPKYEDSLEKRTEEFNIIVSSQSRGEGMMEDDVRALAKFYDVLNPYD